MELWSTAWRYNCLPALAAVVVFVVGCGKGDLPHQLANDDLAGSSCTDESQRLTPNTEQTDIRLTDHAQRILRLPLPELTPETTAKPNPVDEPSPVIKGPRLTFDPPRLEELPPCELPTPAGEPLPDKYAAIDDNTKDDDFQDSGFEFDEDDAEAYLAPVEMFREPVFADDVSTSTEPVVALDEGKKQSQVVAAPGRVFSTEELDDDALIAARTSADDVLAYFPAEAELSDQFRSQVQAAFTLARNGALHAARGRFESLLVELAHAKDASQMTDRHSRSLAAGLRALDEADDFRPAGGDVEVDTLTLAAGHQTPMLREPSVLKDKAKWTLPHEAIAMYHRYAERKLAAAVTEEQAGSMALYGLGKIYQQLAERRDDVPQAMRKSLTMYRGAVRAHGENHLAANEAGVLLARAGRYEQALPLLERAVELSNSSVTHQNLAFVHEKRGVAHLAHAHQREARKLATVEKSRGQLSAERGIAWMSPQEFNRRSGGVRATTGAGQMPSRRATAPPARAQVASSPWQPSGGASGSNPKPATRQRTLWW
ncbi:MAG: hypothetical protein ACR2NU_02875 [Aeoliella sp.]